MSNAKEKFDNNIIEIVRIFGESYQALHTLKYLVSPKDKEEQNVIDTYIFLSNIESPLWKTLIINTFILATEKEHLSLLKQINLLSHNKREFNVVQNIDKKKIKSWIQKIESKEYEKELKNIKGLRNKFVAHYDTSNKQNFSINLAEIEKILDMLLEVFNSYLGCYRDGYYTFNTFDITHIQWMIQDIVGLGKRVRDN